MLELWSTLVPLILVSAVLPSQTIITLLLARTSTKAAIAWVAGMTTARLVQGVLIGFVFSEGEARAGDDSPRIFAGILLLVLATALYVMALRKALGAEDEDAPPPKWTEKAASMSPPAAFGAGAGLMTISFKFLMLTAGAISAIAEAQMARHSAALTFTSFVLLAQSAPIAIGALATSSSSSSAATLDRLRAWIQRNNRAIGIVLGVVFGTWFLIKALAKLSVI
jgi:hypothetical protein